MAEVMDVAGTVLATLRCSTEHDTYAALSELSRVPLWHREHGRPSRSEVAAKKQYLTPSEEKALAGYVLRMADRGYPVPVKLLRYLAWVIARDGPLSSKSLRTMMGLRPQARTGPRAFTNVILS
jgi:hypothetical protein